MRNEKVLSFMAKIEKRKTFRAGCLKVSEPKEKGP
jgi:hypothetical protein